MKINALNFEDINLKNYRNIAFWSWNNKLDKSELVAQIKDMKQAGLGGFFIHARAGLRTEYLSDEWFDCVNISLAEAKKQDMNVWIYDENGWPSGFVGGKLLSDEKNLAPYLEYSVLDYYDEAAIAVYKIENGVPTRAHRKQKLLEYHTIYKRLSPSNTDILNPHVVSKFIQATHEEYYKRFKDSFGKELVGIFTDEPQFYRYATPFTSIMEKEFKSAYDENLYDGLIYLFLNSENSYPFRVKYYTLINKLYTINYYKRVYDWCNEHNCMLTGHSVEEPHIHTQMWGGAGVMPSYEYQHIPGIDHLCRVLDGEIASKQLGSVAQQLGKKFALSESFGCSGWDATPRELKYLADFQYLNGVNIIAIHLMSYSLQGQGKIDNPPSFSKHVKWWDEYRAFNDYFARLSYIFANSKEIVNTLVIHPMQTCYLTYDRKLDDKSVSTLDADFSELVEELSRQGIMHHYGDETLLASHAKVRGNLLIVGNCEYEYVILPKLKTLSIETAEILEQYIKSGGKIYLDGDAPCYLFGEKAEFSHFKSNISLADIKTAQRMQFSNVKAGRVYGKNIIGQFGEFCFFVNKSATESAEIKLDCSKKYVQVDVNSLKEYAVDNILCFKPLESILLRVDSYVMAQKKPINKDCKDITSKFLIEKITSNNLLLDFVQISADGVTFDKPMYTAAVMEKLIKTDYNGVLWVKYSFEIKEIPPKLKIMGDGTNITNILVNGKICEICDSSYDVKFFESDIYKAIKVGRNEIIFTVNYFQNPNVKNTLFGENITESMVNCLTFDTEIEPIYVQGDFELDNNLRLVKKSNVSEFSHLNNVGYPFFAGEVTLVAKIIIKEGSTLSIKGRFMAAEIFVNGKNAGKVLFDDFCDVSKYLISGENKIQIVVKSSLRNMFGPHHVKNMVEPMYAGPFLFNFRNTWNEGKSGWFTPEYNLVKFGIDEILVF